MLPPLDRTPPPPKITKAFPGPGNPFTTRISDHQAQTFENLKEQLELITGYRLGQNVVFARALAALARELERKTADLSFYKLKISEFEEVQKARG